MVLQINYDVILVTSSNYVT